MRTNRICTQDEYNARILEKMRSSKFDGFSKFNSRKAIKSLRIKEETALGTGLIAGALHAVATNKASLPLSVFSGIMVSSATIAIMDAAEIYAKAKNKASFRQKYESPDDKPKKIFDKFISEISIPVPLEFGDEAINREYYEKQKTINEKGNKIMVNSVIAGGLTALARFASGKISNRPASGLSIYKFAMAGMTISAVSMALAEKFGQKSNFEKQI